MSRRRVYTWSLTDAQAPMTPTKLTWNSKESTVNSSP